MGQASTSRRSFLKSAGLFAGTVAVAPAVMGAEKMENTQSVFSAYPKTKIGSLKQLKKEGELDFTYPDGNSLCKAVYVDDQVKAYNTICTHKGCPTVYDKAKQQFECPCHHTKYDAVKNGQMIIGHATGGLPRVLVEIDGDTIYAVGFDGLIFGRINNTRG